METSELTKETFWNDAAPQVLFNTRSGIENEALVDWVKRQEELKGHLLFATSGTTATAKWVCLSKRAILASAEAVNLHLGVSDGDKWFRALPVFHVGGFALSARAYVSNGEVVDMIGDWSAESFVQQLDASASQWVSLVPTQLADIVKAGLRAPSGLRGVIIGGGAARTDLVASAIALGWPVLQSYGMSEACSQLATAKVTGGAMVLLDGVETRLNDSGALEWRSPFLYSGYVNGLEFEAVNEWCQTNDKVEIKGRNLHFIARVDRVVKVLGELVDVEALEAKVNQQADQEVVLVVRAHPRRENCFVPVIECAPSAELALYLTSFRGLEKLEPWQQKTFPRNAMGKVVKRLLKLGE